jgi:Zn-dependent peptidase ImmA (M78 family)
MLNKPALFAQALLEELGIKGTPDVCSVAGALGVEIEEADVESFDGALVRVKGSTKGFIAVRKTIRENGKKNFTIAHELGHLLLPGHDDSTVCLHSDVETWESGLPSHEIEANEFAGELLMPTQLMARLLSGREPSFESIEALANECATSLTATAYRFAQVTDYACAVVWSQEGTARWFKRSEEFRHWIRLREQLDARTLAADCFRGEKIPVNQESVSASAWIDGRVPDDARVHEQTRCMGSYSGALTLLWIPEPFESDREYEETLKELDPDDFGLRRKKWPGRR